MAEKIIISAQSDSVRRRVRQRRDGTVWTYDPPRTRGHGIPVPEKEKPLALMAIPSDPVSQNNLGSELLEWSSLPEAEAIEQFPLSKKFSPYRFYDIALINPYFADCLDAARAAIGFRREKNARTRVEDGNIIMKMQPLYNKEYRDLSLQNSNAESTKVGTIIQVVESPVPDSDRVPKRVVSDN